MHCGTLNWLIFVSPINGAQHLKERICSSKSKPFFRVYPFSFFCLGKQTEVLGPVVQNQLCVFVEKVCAKPSLSFTTKNISVFGLQSHKTLNELTS